MRRACVQPNVCIRPIADISEAVQVEPVGKRLSNPIPWLLGGATLAIAGGYLWLAGSAVVIDETGGVLSAVVTNDEAEQPLRRLWSGYFYAIPELEGTIEIRCRNGVQKQWGYVTGNMHTKIRVVGQTPCARVVDTI